MLYLLDTNILIYAKMNASPEHECVSNWLVNTLDDGTASVLVCETSLLAFLRISTNPKVFAPPLPVKDAREFIGSFLGHPNVTIVHTTVHHYDELTEFMRKYKFPADLVMDAHLATIATRTGAAIATRDKDFKKVPYLKLIDPTANA